MASTVNTPEKLKPYVAHGVNLNIPDDLTGVGAVTGDCPWCSAEMRFNVTTDEGLWRCVKCNIGSVKGGGNVFTFLRTLHAESMKATTESEYKALAQSRGLMFTDTLRAWGVCRSIIDGEWVIPAYSVKNGTTEGGKLTQLYRYVDLNGKMRLLATAGLPHGLHGPDLPTPVGGHQLTRRESAQHGPVYRFEGPWDGMAFWEVARRAYVSDEGNLMPTSNMEASLLWSGSVIAVPGCGVYGPSWAALSANRPDYAFYDNDHPKEHPKGSGRTSQPALEGLQRATDTILKAATPPKEMRYLRWGTTSYHDPNLADGYDVRDHIRGPKGNNGLIERIRAVETLLQKLQSLPQEWTAGREAGGVTIRAETCTTWKDLMTAFRGVHKPTEGNVRVLASCLASVLSVPNLGDQLWLMVVGPPSSGKSTICEALSANRQYVLPKDTLTGLFSGWQLGLGKDENLSLAGELSNKTLVVKDADTVLQSPKCAEIMSQLRGLYDRAMRTQYKNRMSKDWEGLNTTVIIFGTATLYELDAAEKGARYLTVDIQPVHDRELEREIGERTAYRAFKNMRMHANGTAQSQDTPEMLKFKQMTAGYISYLRENSLALTSAIEDLDEKTAGAVTDLGELIAYMRSRPPKKQTEKVERENPYRLISQLMRLSVGLTVVLNKKRIDQEVLAHVRAVALNTAQGSVLTLCDYIRSARATTSNLIAQATGKSHEEAIAVLRFLRKIGAVESYHNTTGMVKTGRPKWRLTPALAGLYSRVFGNAQSAEAVTPDGEE